MPVKPSPAARDNISIGVASAAAIGEALETGWIRASSIRLDARWKQNR